MKQLLTLLLICLLPHLNYALTGNMANPQSLMNGARGISLGGTPMLSGDISSAIINPAILSEIEQFPVALSSQQIMTHFNYIMASTGFQRHIKLKGKNLNKNQLIGFSASFANLSLNGIPKTEEYNDFPYQTGSYNAGYNLLHLGSGTNLYEKFSFNKIAVGTSVKVIQHYVDSETASTFGIDLGLIGTRHINNKYLSKFEIGGSLHNIISPSLKYNSTNNEGTLPFTLYLGAKATLLNDRLRLFGSQNEKGLSIGTEIDIDKGLQTRGSTNFKEVNIGLGIILDDIPTGIPQYNIKGRFDVSYTQNISPMNDHPSYVISLSSLGRSAPKKPQILLPKKEVVLTSESTVRLAGIGPKNTSIRIYNNQQFYRTSLTDKYGNWNLPYLPIHEGENTIQIQSYNLENDFSEKSNKVTIISDSTPPDIQVSVFPDNSILKVAISSDETLENIYAEINNKKIRLKKVSEKTPITTNKNQVEKLYLKPSNYEAKIELPKNLRKNSPPPEDLHTIQVFATDQSGNSTETDPQAFFGTLNFPPDKHVHYKESLLTLGTSSDMVQSIYINKNVVFIDDAQRFSYAIDLEPGKNTIETTLETLNNKALTFSSRVLRLVSYPDLNPKIKGRREIEFLSTLDILHGNDDGNFYPTKEVTRQYITKLMVLAMDEPIDDTVTTDLFDDVAQDHPFAKYIQNGINSGLIFAFPDGTFKPDQALTMSESIYLLSNAGIIDYEEIEESNDYVTRAELAEFLAYTPKFERRIEQLINWDSGYSTKKE